MKPLTQKKTVFHAQCWPQGETFEACKVQMDSLELHVPSNSERLRQSTCASSYFSKGDSIFFFSWKDPALLDLYFLGALPRQKNEPLWMIAPRRKYEEEPEVVETQSRARTPTLFEFYRNIHPPSMEKLISYLLSQRSVISPTCTLFHP